MTPASDLQVHRQSNAPIHHDPDAARLALEAEEQAQLADAARAVRRRAVLAFASRLMLAAVFIVAGLDKLIHFSAATQSLTDLNLNDAGFPLGVGAAFEIGAGILLAVGIGTRQVAAGVIVYLGLVTALVLAFFPAGTARYIALANVGFTAALIQFVANGAGIWSFDQRNEKKFDA